MPTVLDWHPTVESAELIRSIRDVLAAGAPAVLPGDCGYVVLVNPASASGAELLDQLKAPSVLAWGSDDPTGLGLALPIPARRLLARAWPAPLVLEVPGRAEWPEYWPAAVRTRLAANAARFRCPEHPLIETLIPALELPVLVADTFLPTVESALDLVDDSDALGVSIGQLPVGGKPTVVTVRDRGIEITEPGLLSADEIEKLTARIVMFVCTGNTCRSPLAEGLARKLLSERFGCPVDELPRHGVWFLSAGVSAYGELPASPESIAVATEFGVDLADHSSRAVDARLLAATDDVIAMTRGHAEALIARFPGIGPTPRLLCRDGDLHDPIGAGIDVYRDCARTIIDNLGQFIPEWTAK